MGEAASSLCISEDPTSRDLLLEDNWEQPYPWRQPLQDTSGMQGHSLQHRVGCLDPPSPISSCCPWEGGNAEQKAHDEPSKHRLISSPVTWVARVGCDPSLMLRASTRYAVGVQQALRGPGERHGIAEGLSGGPWLCRSSLTGWQCPPLRDGDRQPRPCSQGWGDAERFPSTGPACQCWGAAGCVQTPFATLVPGCHRAPCAARKTLGSTGCQVCSCPVAITHREG